MAKVRAAGGFLVILCPGCGHAHAFDHRWTFNGDTEKPTFHPSHVHVGARGRCHIWIRDGMVEFLQDCEHDHAGQTRELEEWI